MAEERRESLSPACRVLMRAEWGLSTTFNSNLINRPRVWPTRHCYSSWQPCHLACLQWRAAEEATASWHACRLGWPLGRFVFSTACTRAIAHNKVVCLNATVTSPPVIQSTYTDKDLHRQAADCEPECRKKQASPWKRKQAARCGKTFESNSVCRT